MPLTKLVLKPGINRDQTNYASEGGWYECDKIRFRSGFPEKIGGWVVKSTNQYIGTCRSIFPYATTTQVPLLGVSSTIKNYVAVNLAGTTLYDITPLRGIFRGATTNNCFTTTVVGSKQVIVSIAATGAKFGDYISFTGVTGPIGGIPAADFNYTSTNQLSFPISPIVFSDCTYSIAGSVATITKTAHGFLAGNVLNIDFNKTLGTAGTDPATQNYTVLSSPAPTANTFAVTVSGSGSGNAIVTTTIVGNRFAISTATAATSANANGGGTGIIANVEVASGGDSAFSVTSSTTSFGWGAVAWGSGGWGDAGGASISSIIPPRLVFQDYYLNDLFFNIRDASGTALYGTAGTNIFYWTYDSTYGTRAIRLGATFSIPASSTVCTITVPHPWFPLPSPAPSVTLSFLAAVGGDTGLNGTYTITGSTATTFTVTVPSATFVRSGSVEIANLTSVPQQVGQILFAPTGHLLALGCTDITGAYDPLLIRWSNVSPISGPEPEIWYPTTVNTAGDLRLSSGSRIVTSYKTRQEILIFTDFALSSFQFLGTAEVFGAQEIASDLSIMGPNVVFGANNTIYWMGVDKFYIYNGRVDTLPCTLRQYVFQDINISLASTFFAGGNAQFNEVIWFYASGGSTRINRYVIYNYQEQIWYYGQLERTFWTDAGYVNNPIAANNGIIYEHEKGTDDGQLPGASALPINSYIKTADIDMNPDGDKFILLKRIIPDVNFTSSTVANPEAYITVGVRNFPGANSVTTNAENQNLERSVQVGQTVQDGALATTATINQYTNQVFVRARGRQMNFTIGSDTLGAQWQVGFPRFDAREDGRRGGENP